MRNIKFRWLSALLTTVMVATAGVPAIGARAAEITEPASAVDAKFQGGDLVFHAVDELPEISAANAYIYQEGDEESAVQGRDLSYWQQFRSDCFLDTLTDDEKVLYSRYEAACVGYLNDTTSNFDGNYIRVDTSDLSLGNHMTPYQANYMFKLNYPQYFFISNYFSGSYGYLITYNDFKGAAARQNAVNEFCGVVDTWINQINQAALPEEKEKIAHDLVCDWTEYDYDSYYDPSIPHDGDFTRMDWDQSAYSLIHDHLTVCAGYSATSGILLNAVGIETLNVTGDGHAWNMVQLHNYWFLYDTTWDDGDNPGSWNYSYYNRNGVDPDGSYIGGHRLNLSEDQLYTNWPTFVPEQKKYSNCPLDSDVTSGIHQGVYFDEGNFKYFVTNGCSTYGAFTAEVVAGLNGASASDHPATVTHQGKTYAVSYTPGREDQVRAFVSRLYNVFLDREADAAGLNGWTSQLMSNQRTAGEVAAGFIFSPEFTDRNTCNEHFLRYLYLGLFDRAADPDGYNGWTALINDGYCRERVAQGFLTSPEFFDLCASFGVNPGNGLANVPTYGTIQKAHCTIAGCGNEAPVVTLVVGLYNTVFGRTPAQDEIDFWVDMMAAHRPDVTARVMVNSFLNGQEYANLGRNNTEYVQDLYRAIFNREADADGLRDWVNRLDNEGWTRERVLNGFTSSQEFMDQCLRTGIEVGPEV
ncbi:MAG: DUF4214 domain-containing protein [Lachnospiraceae bacterium]|nr:DUF4214 domain-containing protein [Lachnospiraceae bacterium]